MISIILTLIQGFVILLFVFVDNGDITTSGEGVEELTLLVFAIWMGILVNLTQGLL